MNEIWWFLGGVIAGGFSIWSSWWYSDLIALSFWVWILPIMVAIEWIEERDAKKDKKVEVR